MKNRIIRGIPVSPSIAIGKAFLYSAEDISFFSSRRKGNVQEEFSLFEKTRRKSLGQLRALKSDLKRLGNKESTKLIDVQILFLQDPLFLNSVEKRIKNKKESAEKAIINFLKSLKINFKDIEDSYIKERYLDVKDVVDRLLKNIHNKEIDMELPGSDNIVVAKTLTSSEIIQMSRNKVRGIITERGGRTSHIAILTEALNIPTIVGTNGVQEEIEVEDEVIVDGISGIIVIKPDEDTKRRFEQKEREAAAIQQEFLKKKDLPATTIDGYSIDISANIELPIELSSIKKYGAKGVGLLRTEFLYLTSEEIPDEEKQFRFYSEIADVCSPDYVIMRTLDLGGDKVFKTKEKEANPFLGWRGVRFTLGAREIFRIQLRAMLRASAKGNVRLLIPMVSQVEEIIEVRKIVEDVKEELRKEGYPFDENIEIGAMVEIPSVSLLADHFSKEVDFLSIGTNDLTQYTLAVDRGNKRVSALFDHLDPSVISLMKMTVKGAHHNNKWVGVCGEMACDLVAMPVLIGLEVDELSLPPTFIPQVKNVIRGLSLKESKKLLEKVEKKESANNVRGFLKKELLKRFPSLKNILVEVENDRNYR